MKNLHESATDSSYVGESRDSSGFAQSMVETVANHLSHAWNLNESCWSSATDDLPRIEFSLKRVPLFFESKTLKSIEIHWNLLMFGRFWSPSLMFPKNFCVLSLQWKRIYAQQLKGPWPFWWPHSLAHTPGRLQTVGRSVEVHIDTWCLDMSWYMSVQHQHLQLLHKWRATQTKILLLQLGTKE